MRLFLDASVLPAASGSTSGASRELFRRAPGNGWILIATPYVIEEVFTLDRPAVFGPAKDRPILYAALAWADVLPTLDRSDFGGFMNKPFYGLAVLTPAMFLDRERAAGRLY